MTADWSVESALRRFAGASSLGELGGAALQPVRRRGSSSAIAPACWLRIACHRNSSNGISPGWVGGRCVGSRRETISRAGRVPFRRPLVVVRDLDIVGISILPAKADAEGVWF